MFNSSYYTFSRRHLCHAMVTPVGLPKQERPPVQESLSINGEHRVSALSVYGIGESIASSLPEQL